MAKKLFVGNYTFDASLRAITLHGHVAAEELLIITNVVDNEIIYSFADPLKGYTSHQFATDEYDNPITIMTLAANTTGMSDSDKLQIFVEMAHQEFTPSEDLLDPVGKLRVSNPGNLIDTDFEYGLQSTKWESIQTVNNIPTIYSSNGDIPIEGISDATIGVGNKTVTVTGGVAHGLAIGDPVSVSGMDLYTANGYFIVTSVADDFTFSYDMDVASPFSGSIYGSYTTIIPSKFFEGSSLNIDVADGVVSDEGSPSTLTVKTQETHGFQNGTKVYVRNTAGPRTFIVDDSAATAPDGRPYVDTTESFPENVNFNIANSTGRGGSLDKEIFTYDWESTYTRYIGPTDIDPAADTITWNNHGLETNYRLLFNTPIRGDNMMGLTDGTVYYVQVIDVNTIKLTTTFDPTGTTGSPAVSLGAWEGDYGYPRLGLVYEITGANGTRRDTKFASGGGGGAGSINIDSSSQMNFSGTGTQGDPIVSTSTNRTNNSASFLSMSVAGGTGELFYNITVSSEGNFDFGRFEVNGSQLVSISGNRAQSGSLQVAAGDTIVFRYTKDGSVSRGSDSSTMNLYIVPVGGGGGATITTQVSGSDLAGEEFGLGVLAPTSLVAFQRPALGVGSFDQDDELSYLANQRDNGRYGTQSIMYPALSVSNGNLAGSFNVSVTNTIESYSDNQIFYVFARPLASQRNTIYSPAHGLRDGQIIDVNVDPTAFNNGQRFRFNSASGPTTINDQTFVATVSLISNDVFRMTVDQDPFTDDIGDFPSAWSITYERLNDTFNTLYIGNHRIPESVEAVYSTGAGGTAPSGFDDGSTYLLTRVNDDRVSFSVGGAVQSSSFAAANTAAFGTTSNALINRFVNIQQDLGLTNAPTTAIITNIYGRGDLSAGSEYIDINFPGEGTNYRLFQNDDSGDTASWTRSTTWQPKSITSFLTQSGNNVGFNVNVDPSTAVNYGPGMTNWWELIFEVEGTSGIVFVDPGSGQQIFDVDSTIGAYDGVYTVSSVDTVDSFKLQGDFKIPALSFNFTSAEVDTPSDTIDLQSNHNFVTGEKVTFSTTGTQVYPSGVSELFVIVTGRQSVGLAGSYVDAISGTKLALTATSGAHTLSTTNIIKGVKGKGNLSATNGTKDIQGLGTRFLSNFKRFDKIYIDNGTFAQEFTVNTVTSDGTMTVFEDLTFSISNTDYYYSTQLILRPDGYNLHKSFDGGVDITAGTSPYSKIVRQSRKYFRYQSGKGIQNSFAINFNPPKIVRELIRASGVTATIVTQEAHNLRIGDQIKIEGATVDFGENYYNGIFPVTGVPDDFTFQYTMTGAPLDTRAGGFPTYVRTGWSDSFVRAGMFDDQNGFFMEYDGQKLYMVRRSSTLQLSGSISPVRGSQVITGQGTSFTSQLEVGNMIVVRGQSYQIVEVSSDNRLVVQPAYRGIDATLVKCTKTIDTKVPQENWSLDPADGTGPSKFNLDTTKIQMAYADYSWYGAGKIRYGFKDLQGHIRYLHEFTHNNRLDESYFRSGNLPARYEIANGPNPSTAPTLFHFGTSIIMDGRFDDDKAYQFTSSSRQMTLTDGNVNTYVTTSASGFSQVVLNGKRVWVYRLHIDDVEANNLTIGMRAVDSSLSIPVDTHITQLKSDGSGTTEVYLGYPATQTDPSGSPLYPQVQNGTGIQFGDRAELDDYIPLTSVRLAPSVDSGITGSLGQREIVNRMQLALKNAAVTANADTEVYLILNALPIRLKYENAQRPSLSEIIDHQIEDTLLNATVVYSAKVSANQSLEIELGELLEVGNSILGGDGVFPAGPDLLTLAVQPQTTSGFDFTNPYRVSGKLSWAESQA